MLGLYAAADARRWDEANAMQDRVARFLNGVEKFIEATGEGMQDPVFDKGMALASGCLAGHQRCRPPYIGWSDQTVAHLREWLMSHYPEFIYQGSEAS